MITEIAAAITERLESLAIFHSVERKITKQTRSNPPAAVFYLAGEHPVQESPEMMRRLNWDILVIARALDTGIGQKSADYCIDAVRNAFFGWMPVSAGCNPAVPGEIVLLESAAGGNLVYAMELGIECYPSYFK